MSAKTTGFATVSTTSIAANPTGKERTRSRCSGHEPPRSRRPKFSRPRCTRADTDRMHRIESGRARPWSRRHKIFKSSSHDSPACSSQLTRTGHPGLESCRLGDTFVAGLFVALGTRIRTRHKRKTAKTRADLPPQWRQAAKGQ